MAFIFSTRTLSCSRPSSEELVRRVSQRSKATAWIEIEDEGRGSREE
jgi:hypothetical protein